MTTLAGFERNLQDSIMEDAEANLYGERDNIAFNFLQSANDNFRDYAARHGYDLESIIESGQVTDTSRGGRSVSATIEWTSGLAGIYEYGASEHTINGDPILSFIWSDPPNWVKEQFPQGRTSGGQFVSGWRVFFESVEHPGVPESRAIRDALTFLELQTEGSVTL